MKAPARALFYRSPDGMAPTPEKRSKPPGDRTTVGPCERKPILCTKPPGVAAALAVAVPLDEKAVAWLALDRKLPGPFEGLVMAALALATAGLPVAVVVRCTPIADCGCASGPKDRPDGAKAVPWSAVAGGDGDVLEAVLLPLAETFSPDAKLVASVAFGPLWKAPAVIRSI